jgi:nitrate reductase molybdenum cofactor assembly chaperone NarJ/NarW
MSDVVTTRRLLAACSLLLSYPDEETVARIPLVRDHLAELPGQSRTALDRFLDWLGSTDVLAAQEHYVEIFDRRRKACLYLTYFLNGDTRGRGMALVGFKEAYKSVGFTIDTGELPDFLPVVLEFGAVGDLDAALGILGRHRAGLELLHHALDGFGSPYADVAAALLPVVPTGMEGPKAAELAASGPPTEMVGLTPFIPVESLRVGART